MYNVPDIVFTWAGINSNSPRNRYNYELFYSIKSVLKYMPWCNNIYILVNRNIEIPVNIINLNKEKIKKVNRSDLFDDQSISMTQNSFAVYSIVDKIPNLGERFILFDDDFMISSPLSISYFFRESYPIVRNIHIKKKIYDKNVVIPSELKRPKYKYRKHSHRPMPCTK